MRLRTQIINLLAGIPLDFGGGCSASKAYLLASLIRELRTQTSLDIGVYRGRSLLPQALAHRRYTGGVAYGVDPWSKDEARENDNPALKRDLDRFVETTDFEAIYRAVDNLRKAAAVEDHCALVRKTSVAAAAHFRERRVTFGLIHIDGNHDTAAVVRDVRDFEPLLQRNGILVMDDVSWDSVRPAYDLLAATMPRLFQRVDTLNDYAVFWKTDALPPLAPPWHALFNEDYVVSG
jgi:predicted O-methyltransferase YrrM